MRSLSALALAVSLLAVSACDSSSDDDNGPPRTVRITKVTVLKAPLMDEDGDGWDGGNPLSDGPDIYFRLFDDLDDYQTDSGRDLLNPRDDDGIDAVSSDQAWYSNVDGGDFPLVWDIDPGFLVRDRDFDRPLYVALFDYDPIGGDDPMAASVPFSLGDIAPATVTGRAETLDLTGFDRDGGPLGNDEFTIRLTVVFED